METVQNVFELPLTVREDDIDQLGHVNNVVYVRWVQEAAIAHWSVLATAEERAKLLWVVIRHEIDYKNAAFLNDAIVARTWVGDAEGLAFERNTEIVRVSDRKLLAKRHGHCGVRWMRKRCGLRSPEPKCGRSSRVRHRR